MADYNLVFQQKSFFSLVEDLFNLFEGLRRSVIIGIESESEWIFDLAGLQKSCRYVVKFRALKTPI